MANLNVSKKQACFQTGDISWSRDVIVMSLHHAMGAYKDAHCLCIMLWVIVQGQRACEPQAQARLQLQAFEAINEVVRGASDATQPLVGHLVPLMLSKISNTFQAPPAGAHADARMRQQELQVQAPASSHSMILC